ncbi:hypothetical protein [Mycoplasma seminis]|uniref:Tape measure protein n=1 Tax=Mycoplasma seminis TaxID=512749 RepID=A0ABY9H9L8_9MOLU|nr:hypothetical protein [Mycoplasma seminis]WLP85283.1 hypothetical protein Q8852_03090 [Mycoplasma seminis]
MIGKVTLGVGLDNKSIDKTLKQMSKKFKRAVGDLKTMFIAQKLGSYLFAGADKSIQEYMAKARQIATLQEAGIGKEMSEKLFELSDNFEKLGYSAEVANDAFSQFIMTGKATTLQGIGIYLDKNTKSTLAAASAQQRLNYLLKDGNRLYGEQAKAMPKNIANMIKLKKSGEDLQKALGQVFLSTIEGVINALGGIKPAMISAIWAFTAYKTAMILGNVGIGISKAIAQAGVWSTPAALAMGGAALAGIGMMIGAAALATAAISNSNIDAPIDGGSANVPEPAVNIKIVQDRYGSMQEVQKASGSPRKAQTSYGSSN